MKKIKKMTVLIVGVTLLSLNSCKKEKVGSAQQKSYGNLQEFFEANMFNEIQFTTINNSDFEGDTILGSKGAQLFFNRNAFETMGGVPVTGAIQIGFIEMYSKKDMILLNKPNMEKRSGELSALVSAGTFFIEAKQNGQKLRLRQNEYCIMNHIPAEDENIPMNFLYGEANGSNQLEWIEAQGGQIPYQHNIVYGAIGKYHVSHPFLDWINVGHSLQTSGIQSAIHVELPAGYTAENTAVYISIDGVESVGGLYNFQSGVFSSSSNYKLPVGENVHFVVISYQNNMLQAAIVPATIGSNHVESVSILNPISASELAVLLNDLP